MKSYLAKVISRVSQLGDARWRHFYWQRLFLSQVKRDKVADRIGRKRNDIIFGNDTIAEEKGQSLRTDGFLPLGELLSREQCDELVTYFRSKYVVDFYRPELKEFLPDDPGRHPHTSTGQHDELDVIRAPYLIGLANDPSILRVLEGYFHCKPTISKISAWWSFPTGLGAQQAENFHRDVDDWRFVKLFVYLTDVDHETGPHMFVRWSPSEDRLNEIRRFTDQEVFREFESQFIITIKGRAGTGFLENTFGLHRGYPVEKGKRLLFQVIYSLVPLPYGPKYPILQRTMIDQGTKFDSWINRVYLK